MMFRISKDAKFWIETVFTALASMVCVFALIVFYILVDQTLFYLDDIDNNVEDINNKVEFIDYKMSYIRDDN